MGVCQKKPLEIFRKRAIKAEYEHLFVGILCDEAGPRDEYYCLSGSCDAVHNTMAVAERMGIPLLTEVQHRQRLLRSCGFS